MRSLYCLPLLLALAMPSVAWSGPAEQAQRPVSAAAPHRAVAQPSAGQSSRGPGYTADPAALCETAVNTAEYVNRLPQRLLGAISLTETGRFDAASGHIRPWPWTINAEGEGHFFETKQDAIAGVRTLQARGVRSIDVGCLQVNLMYHADAFASLDAAFDPHDNANYAAHFLNRLYSAGKEWAHAIGAYHSETPALGDAYRVLVMARWQNADLHPVVVDHAAYQDFAPADRAAGERPNPAYGAFAPRSRVYGAFAPR